MSEKNSMHFIEKETPIIDLAEVRRIKEMNLEKLVAEAGEQIDQIVGYGKEQYLAHNKKLEALDVWKMKEVARDLFIAQASKKQVDPAYAKSVMWSLITKFAQYRDDISG